MGEEDAHLGADGNGEAGEPEPEDLPTRVCPRCSTQAKTAERFCAHCGAPYERRRPRLSRRAKLVMGAVLGALLVIGVGAGVYAKVQHDQDVREERERAARLAADRREAARKRRERQRQIAAAEARAEAVELELRVDAIKDMQAAISEDARDKVDEGLLDGPILGTTCDARGGSDPTDLEESASEFTCIASTKKSDDGTRSGYRFTATMDWDDGSYSWRLGG